MKDLPDILENIVIEEYEEGLEGKIEKMVAEQMPGYEVYTWDADAQGLVDFAEEYTSIIGQSIKSGIEEIQMGEWSSEDMKIYLVVIAIKTKGDK